jgi:hypothetical protein
VVIKSTLRAHADVLTAEIGALSESIKRTAFNREHTLGDLNTLLTELYKRGYKLAKIE